jgi:hypothetical protein
VTFCEENLTPPAHPKGELAINLLLRLCLHFQFPLKADFTLAKNIKIGKTSNFGEISGKFRENCAKNREIEDNFDKIFRGCPKNTTRPNSLLYE